MEAHKLEQAVDLESGAVVAVTVQAIDGGDNASLPETLDEAEPQLAELGGGAATEVACDKGYHSNRTMTDLAERGSSSLPSLEAHHERRLPGDVMEESNTGVIEKLNLREGSHLKRAAVLLFHPTPQRLIGEAYVKIGHFRGSELLYQDVIEGDLFTQVDRTVDLLYTKYTRALVSYRGVSRVETFPVPREAIREAVVNAVIHRDYTRPAPSQIRAYDDRIMLWNPGRLPEGWSLEKLTGSHPSQPHNPVIANAFFRAGLIEAWGLGVQGSSQVARSWAVPCPNGGLSPRTGCGSSSRSRLGTGQPTRGLQGKATDRETTQEVPETTQETREATQEVASTTQETAQEVVDATQEGVPAAQQVAPTATATAPTSRERILALLKAEPRITRRLLAERIGITPRGVKYHLTKLRKAGIIRHVGPTKAGRWEVLK